jgi:nicotinate-nucleotide adenylyltransferase
MRMVELAVADQPRLRASRIEVDRGGVSYTIDTLRALTGQSPARRFTLLLGADAALQIRGWHQVEILLAEASVVIFDRPQTSLRPQTIHELGFAPERTRIVHVETPDISAHQVRDRLARGAPIGDLVPAAVADYIVAHRLYQPAGQLG